jgi:hypothetical protein
MLRGMQAQRPISLSAVALLFAGLPLQAQQTNPAPVDPLAVEPTKVVPTEVAPFKKGIEWQVGETKIKFGGYFKVDLLHDFDEIGSTDSFDPRTIPTPGEDGTATRLHARQTRFNLDLRGPSSAGEFRGFFEGDFFSDQNGFRMRHAYGTLGPLLGGQTWTTFMDEDAMPETLDFESPIAFPQIRQTQVRYTHDLGEGDYFAVSLEDPDSDVLVPTDVGGDPLGESEEPYPDLNARWREAFDGGHVQVGGFLGIARFEPEVGSADDVTLWGVNLSTKLGVLERDNVFVQATYGDGVGRYRGGITAAPDASGNLEAVTVLGWMLGYEHHWSDEYRSSVSYSWADGDVPDGAGPDTTETLDYLAANLIWQFADRAWTGIEYLYGSRDSLDGESGDASRIQLSLRFDI